MEAQPISPELINTYETERLINMGPPKGVAEEDCYTLEVLQGDISKGVFDGSPFFRSFWKPSEEELKILNDGGVVELNIIGIFPPVSVGVNDGRIQREIY